MPECHKCPYNGKGSDKCLTCAGPPETNHKGRVHISRDAGRGAQTLGEVEAATGVWRRQAHLQEANMPKIHPDAAKVAVAMLSLSAKEFQLVQGLMRDGKSMVTIAGEMGLTRAAVSAQVKKLVERHPVFSFLRAGRG